MTTNNQSISNDFQVALTIWEYNQRGEPIDYRKLSEIMLLSGRELNSILDRGYDLCIFDYEWKLIGKTWWHTIKIDESFEPFVRGLYNSTEEL
jgi:hypothetical protein